MKTPDSTMHFLGILMLDTQFPRPLGDIGHPGSFETLNIPVRYRVVIGASPSRVVKEADPALLVPFIESARVLVEQGATMIGTSCGFLAMYQEELQRALSVPVVTSSLLQCAALERPGIVTIDARSLSPRVLEGAGVATGTPIQGTEPGCEFHRRILSNDTTLDLQEAERNVTDAAIALIARHPTVQNIVLECTNMPPYRQAVARATGREIHDVMSLLEARWRAETQHRPC